MREQLYRAVRAVRPFCPAGKTQAAFLFAILTGCSTAPVADFLDFFFPPRMDLGANPVGGVCQPKVVGPAPPGTAQPVVPPPGVQPVPSVIPGPPAPATAIPDPPPPPPQVGTTLQLPVPATPVDNTRFPKS
jgi:hypothetical protein